MKPFAYLSAGEGEVTRGSQEPTRISWGAWPVLANSVSAAAVEQTDMKNKGGAIIRFLHALDMDLEFATS